MSRSKIDYGIDLGTTNSSIARMENSESVIKKSEGLQKDTTPSCVHFNKKKATVVGDKALDIFIKEKLFAGKDIQLDFINNNTNWAISVDTERTAIYLGYLWGVFIKTTETNRWLKTGIGIGTGYFKYKADLNLCSNYEVSIKEGTDVYHSGKCNGKTKFGEISVDGPVTTFAGNFVIFERKTPDSIWKIINANLSVTFTNAETRWLCYR